MRGPAAMAEFQKVLIANRGEIAIRVMRAANELGKRTVAVYAEEDKLSLHRFKAGRGLQDRRRHGTGGGLSLDPRDHPGCETVWRGCDPPGYGLLSENPDFVDACTEAGITFIGRKPRPCDNWATRPPRARWRSRQGCRSFRRPRCLATISTRSARRPPRSVSR
ncbi:biotin carboxylase N-terminal domain-containing protein [Celeribacter ethanolicus]|uniref:biotin carboxylase N-terminal domain-containing protein n=1 Tax=Celeribacter ethanolicus TaxID=1758178 RepID=UPI003CC811C5